MMSTRAWGASLISEKGSMRRGLTASDLSGGIDNESIRIRV